MLIAAAVCPHPPLLVPDVAAGAAGELDDLRAACFEAVRRLLDSGADLIAVVGAGGETRDFGADPAGSLRPYGLDMTMGPGTPVLPLSLTIGRWLLEHGSCGGRTVRTGRTIWHGVGAQEPALACRGMGVRIAGLARRVGMLCMGDGSCYRGSRAPGYVDPRAADFDAAVATALGGADPAALAGLDPLLAAELTVAGRPAWQVLAGAAGRTPFSGELLADQAPYGVRYYVASWTGG
jgi:hypothetical protein